MIEKTKQYAVKCHNDTNCLYDGKHFEVHLQMVFDAATKFIHLIPENERENVLASCWGHDVIEDCRQTYNDVKQNTNLSIADLVYALTNEKGKNRKERANEKYYLGIRNQPYATFVKVCDRIANYQYSKQQNSNMAKLYEKEMKDFFDQLYVSKYQEMFDYLVNLQQDGQK